MKTYTLYIEQYTRINGVTRHPYGVYATEADANKAIMDYYKGENLGYYWQYYLLPPDDELAGGKHIDFGSHSTFFILMEEDTEV